MNPTTTSTTEHRDASRRSEGVATSIHPVVAGFHPDPTICRVGDEYYLAHSSFEYFPGVPIWRSTDLCTWEQIGNVLTRADQFTAGSAGASKGVYAPTLRHRDGRFWLITTDVTGGQGQLVTWAEQAAGPWSPGIRLADLIGIDPDLAWSEDGTCYVTYCSTDPGLPGIAQARVDLDEGTVLGEPWTIWRGTGLAFPEAPHLYYREGWWYLVIAEGGTERGHAVSVARSARIDGPFVGREGNPVFSHRSTTSPVQNTGHADLVETADGSWAMVYLGVRPRGVTPMFHVNGRETFLAGVDWVDGWPTVDEERYVRPVPDRSFSDDLRAEDLHPRWVSPGACLSEQIVEAGPEGMVLRPGSASSGAMSALTTRVVSQHWAFEAEVDGGDGVAGLVVRLDDDHWMEARVGSSSAWAVVHVGPFETTPRPPVQVDVGPVTLRVVSSESLSDGPDDVSLSIVTAGGEVPLARLDGRYLSTEVAGGFTGRVVGVRALEGTIRLLRVHYVDQDPFEIASVSDGID